jgi:cobalt-precorrin 5A hydrolase/precorrin-3B C17-methyltransferase
MSGSQMSGSGRQARVVSVSITERGAALAAKLPYEHRHGRLMDTVREEWEHCDGLIVFAAAGLVVRAVAPLLHDKHHDPAVVSVDETGQHAVVLVGGHQRNGNDLGRQVAALTGATPVISTATDLAGLPAVDAIEGFTARGDIAGLSRQWLDGNPPTLSVDDALGAWPVPSCLADLATTNATEQTDIAASPLLRVSDGVTDIRPGEVTLVPRCLVVGVGASKGASTEGLYDAVHQALSSAGLDVSAVAAVATLDAKAAEPAIVELAERLGVGIVSLGASLLSSVEVPNPSEIVREAVGTPSVAEAAAVVAAGPGSRLVSTKTVSATRDSTVAIARRLSAAGSLHVVGLGPGHPAMRTFQAAAAVRHAEVVVGYSGYIDAARDLLSSSQQVISYPIGAEGDRVRHALELAAQGRRVALVCSGDPGVYALASLTFEVAEELAAFSVPPEASARRTCPDESPARPATRPRKAPSATPVVHVVAGVTAALSAAALLGAPLGHDHATVSLSDLLTPWEHIERRVVAAAEGDFVVSFYNPRSARRSTQLPSALKIMSLHRAPATPAAVVTDAGRPTQTIIRTVLGDLDPRTVGMFSLVVVGSTTTRWIGDRMVTPRGYRP